MKRKNKYKKKRDKTIPVLKGAIKNDLMNIENPFKNLSSFEFGELLKAHGSIKQTEFSDNLQKMKEYIKQFNVLDLICYFSMYYLSSTNAATQDIDKKESLLQFHVELLQALLLQNVFEKNSKFNKISPKNATEIEKLLMKITEAFKFQRYSNIDINNEANVKKLMALEYFRIKTMAIRNWGYPAQIFRITRELFDPLDTSIENKMGISILKLLNMCELLIKKIEDKLNLHRRNLHQIIKAKNVIHMIDLFKYNYPEIQISRKELLEICNKFKSKKDFSNFLFIVSELSIKYIYTFSLDNCIELYPSPINPNILERVLDNWSIECAGLKNYPTDYIFLGNPIWKKPLIKIADKKYCWPIPSLILHFCIDLMKSIFMEDSELKEKYEKRRAKFLEESIESCFTRAIPHSRIYKNSIWNDGKEDFENDLLALIDSSAFIIEAKSGKISEAAMRGGFESLKNEIRELMVDPSLQTLKFKKHLERNFPVVELRNKKGDKFTLDLSNIKNFINLSITLESFGIFSAKSKELFEVGLIENKDDMIPNMSLTDLEIIFDLLETTSEKIHYFFRRPIFEENANYTADETDLLAFYLLTGFNIGDAEFNGMPIILHGESQKLDNYYLNLTGIKPWPRRTKYWQDILLKLEKGMIPGWTEISNILLNVSFEDQQTIEKRFIKIKKTTKNKWGDPSLENIIAFANGPIQRRDLIIFIAYKELSKENRDNLIRNAAFKAMNKYNLDNALILGVDIDSAHYPYSFLGIFKMKGDKQEEGIGA